MTYAVAAGTEEGVRGKNPNSRSDALRALLLSGKKITGIFQFPGGEIRPHDTISLDAEFWSSEDAIKLRQLLPEAVHVVVDLRAFREKNPCCCNDCRKLGEMYMVKNEVWLEAWPTYKMDRVLSRDRILLCLSCLEHRLGRRLKLSDFTDDRINAAIRFGAALPKED